MCCFGASAQAAEVTIKLPTDERAGQVYTLRLFKDDEKSEAVYYDEAVSDGENVTFTFDFGGKSGEYPYIAVSDSGEKTISGALSFVNDDELKTAVEKLKEALGISDSDKKAEAVKNVLTEYYNEFKLGENFSVDKDIKNLNTSAAYKNIASLITDAADSENVAKVYKEQMLLCAAEYGSGELIAKIDSEFLSHFGEFSENVKAEYDSFSDKQKTDTALMQKGKYQSGADFLLSFNKSVFITSANSCSVWQELSEKIKKFNTDAQLGCGSLQNTVVQKLSEKLPFKSEEDFLSKLKSAEKSAANNSHASTSTGGGGGGGGSSRPSAALPSADSSNSDDTKKREFSDMSDYSWAKEAVEYLAGSGIVNGRSETEFAPGESIKREEFIKIIVCAFKLPESDDNSFTDTDKSQWYMPYISSAAACGIVKGMEDGRVGIGENITREDAAVIIARAVEFSGRALEYEKPPFTDFESISDYAKNAVGALYKSGAVSGMPGGEFMPKNTITRAETAKIIYSVIR